MFNATLNNISVTLWQSVLLVEETGVPGENHQPVVSHWQTLSHNVVSSTLRLSGIRTHNVTDYVGSCKFNYQLITTTMTPHNITMAIEITCTCVVYIIALFVYLHSVVYMNFQGCNNIYLQVESSMFFTYTIKLRMYFRLLVYVCFFLSTSFHIEYYVHCFSPISSSRSEYSFSPL